MIDDAHFHELGECEILSSLMGGIESDGFSDKGSEWFKYSEKVS